jgi:chromosomal replication initiation ATPase DnaA
MPIRTGIFDRAANGLFNFSTKTMKQTKINPMAIPGLSTIEDVAASIWEIEKADLFAKIRKREVVEARQSLMKFRNENMGHSLASAAKYYGLDHCTAIHAIRTVDILRDTDKSFRSRHDLFIERVSKYTNQINP